MINYNNIVTTITPIKNTSIITTKHESEYAIIDPRAEQKAIKNGNKQTYKWSMFSIFCILGIIALVPVGFIQGYLKSLMAIFINNLDYSYTASKTVLVLLPAIALILAIAAFIFALIAKRNHNRFRNFVFFVSILLIISCGLLFFSNVGQPSYKKSENAIIYENFMKYSEGGK